MSNPPQNKPKTGPPVVLPGGSGTGNNIVINPLQRGNPIMECIRNVGKEFGDIVCDYQVGRTTGVLFLSLKYHRLHPEYIHTRIEKLGISYNLRLLLVLCDITEHRDSIRELTKTCLINNITVITAFSNDEAGHYLSTFKQFEHKPPDLIRERVDKDYNSVLRASLTSISKVNKTDVETLRTTFGSFAGVAKATTEQLQNLPGFGQVKVKNVKTAFEKPLRNAATNSISDMLLAQSQSQSQLDKGKGKEVATEEDRDAIESEALAASRSTNDGGASKAPTAPRPRAPRSPSPAWDIEQDLSDGEGPPGDKQTEPFDIELDLT